MVRNKAAMGAGRTFDGVRLAVLSKRFESVASKMANTLLRTGRSGVLNMARDFSCCVVTADCELISAAECYPIHVLRGADIMAAAMKEFHPELRHGDAFLHNSPYHGNSHAADHVILVPVIDDDGVHRFTVLAKAHQADCGNSMATTYMGAARDVYEEGALIFPAVQVQRDYEDIQDIIRMCELRIRVPSQWRGDYLAMLGAARIGERAMLEMGRDVGWDTLEQYTQEYFDYGEYLMIQAVREMPSGKASATATHDPVPGTPEHGITVKAEVAVESENARISVDLRDNPQAYPCGLNLSQACALSACMVGVFNTVGHKVPPNAGSYRRIDVLLGEGTVCGIPRHPTSTSVATTNLGDRVTCAVQRALADIGDGIGMADGGAAIPATGAVISGSDPRHDGAPFCNEVILLGGSGPGTPYTDGWLTMLTMGNAGMPLVDSIEVDEIHHPMLVTERRLIPDSEGEGRFPRRARLPGGIRPGGLRYGARLRLRRQPESGEGCPWRRRGLPRTPLQADRGAGRAGRGAGYQCPICPQARGDGDLLHTRRRRLRPTVGARSRTRAEGRDRRLDHARPGPRRLWRDHRFERFGRRGRYRGAPGRHGWLNGRAWPRRRQAVTVARNPG